MMKQASRKERHERKHARVRKGVSGTPKRPRFCVYKSNKHLYAQIVNDEENRSLITVSTAAKEIRTQVKSTDSLEAAKALGEAVANKAKEKGITAVVFDRGGYPYHGKVKAIADAARKGGMQF